ncbi:MAG: porphobilinogen synthase [bacterium]
MGFIRLSRLRRKESLRKLVQGIRISVKDFVLPVFVLEGKNRKEEISSMPGVFRFSPDNLIKEIEEVKKLGIIAVLLFGVPEEKDEKGSSAFDKNGIVQKAVKKIRQEFPDMVLITDVCLCGYTSHGHCGITKIKSCIIDNDATLKILSKIALSHAQAGADIVAPSAMMDGQVTTIRETLDKKGFKDVAIMGYSAKYSSGFYGPFREAAQSSPHFGDRKSYQMDYHNVREALREVEADIKEGADIVMVKPALTYLDVIKTVKDNYGIPLAAYNVSGEYSMVKAASMQGWLNEKKAVLEILTSIKRAGADIIITYWAKDAAKWLRK